MARLLALTLLVVLGSLQVQAVSIDLGKEQAGPLPPLKFKVTNGQLIDVEYCDPAGLRPKDSLLLQVTMERKNGSEKETFSLLVPPVGIQKIGLIQGWTPQHGDKIHIEATGYRTTVLGN